MFSAKQVDGFEKPQAATVSPIERNACADAFMAATDSEVRHGGQSAHYDPREDIIQMPEAGLFTGTSNVIEGYDLTLLHETRHWTG